MGLKWRSFIVGFFSCLLAVGCAGFTIRYYGMEGVVYEQGKLLGPSPKYDRPFSDCAPDAEFKKGKCVVMFFTEFDTLKKDYLTCKSDLNDCQRYCQQN